MVAPVLCRGRNVYLVGSGLVRVATKANAPPIAATATSSQAVLPSIARAVRIAPPAAAPQLTAFARDRRVTTTIDLLGVAVADFGPGGADRGRHGGHHLALVDLAVVLEALFDLVEDGIGGRSRDPDALDCVDLVHSY